MSLYRRLLSNLRAGGAACVFSHELAVMAGGTAAQVRRDMMALGFSGSPARGYDIERLIEAINAMLDAPSREGVALVGVGNLGRAILKFLEGRRPSLSVTAAFDVNPEKIDRVLCGCRCHAFESLPDVVRGQGIRTGIIAVPAAAAQLVADALVGAGIRGILNFAPAPLRVPPQVFVDDLDIAMSLEKVAFFARRTEQEFGTPAVSGSGKVKEAVSWQAAAGGMHTRNTEGI